MAKATVLTETCKGCGLCTLACPKKIVALSKTVLNSKGHHPAEIIKPEDCIGCAMCATVCPDVAIVVER